MINIKDIRVGDYLRVNRDVCIKKCTIVEVRGTDADNRFENHTGCASCHPLDDNQFDGGIWLDYLDPIPLTPEILENNGFIEDNTNRLHSTYHLLVPAGIEKNIYTVQVTIYKEPICGVSTLFKCWGSYGGGVNDIHLCNLHYVHEMQHALRLCGIDKSIEL